VNKVDYLFQLGTKAFWPHLDLVAPLHSAYAKRHGVEYICYRGPFPTSPWPGGLASDQAWKQYSIMLDLVHDENTGMIFYADADTLIVGDKDPRPVMDGYLVGMTWHPKNRSHIGHYNRGVFFIRACKQVGDLLERVMKNGPDKAPHYDQGLLNKYLAEPQWDGKLKTLPSEWNSIVKLADSEKCVIRAWHGMGNVHKRFQAMQAEMRRRGL